jgi:hypothetical protein
MGAQVRCKNMKINTDIISSNFYCLEANIKDINNLELAVINSDIVPEYKLAINKILTAVQNCDFYGD